MAAIDVGLLTLKEAAKASTGNLKREIDETQGLVKQSTKTITRLAHECDIQHKT